MDTEELEKFLKKEIPLTAYLGLKVISHGTDKVELRAPLHPNHNHMGTAFGGSLSTMMILAGYTWLYQAMHERNQTVHVILQSQNVEFFTPVQEDIRAICLPPEQSVLEEFFRLYDRKGLARISLHTFIEIAGGKAASMKGEFVAQKVKA